MPSEPIPFTVARMESTEDIKSRLDIVDLVGEYLPLKPAGSGAFKALCPFHGERSASFYVSRSRQTWHCFGCNEGGDHFSFVQKIEGMDFREALQYLAQKTGVQLPKFDHKQLDQKNRLIEVNDLAVRFFRSALANLPQAEHARAYLKKRGLDELTSDLFKLGYAPDGWSTLSDALLKKGVTADELIRAGLSSKRERGDGVYDRFRDRIMFPISDVHGNVVGFTGRILSDEKKEAKYVNTPETSLYKKSSVLYGLDKARGEIRQKDLVVLVEGNMDVISSHQFGIGNVVACSGTALTGEQLALLKRFTTKLAIAFDQDSAGKAATVRGLDLARQLDFSIKIISLPPDAGKDPDDAVRKDPEIWKKAIADAVNIMDWLYRQAFARHPQHTPEGKKLIAQDLLPELRRMNDPVERDSWLKRLSQDLQVSESALLDAIQIQRAKAPTTTSPSRPLTLGGKPAPAANPIPQITKKPEVDPEEERERRLLALCATHPELLRAAIQDHHLEPGEFRQPTHALLYEQLKSGYDPSKSKNPPPGTPSGLSLAPPSHLSGDARAVFEPVAFLAERDFLSQSLPELMRELQTLLSSFRLQRKAARLKELEQAMRDAERAGDSARIAALAEQFRVLYQ